MSETQIIEIGGVKVEVDLRQAKRVETVKVGTRVKVLRKKKEYTSQEVYTGVVIGFEPFRDLPTILVCYLEQSYNTAELRFMSFNSTTTDYDLIVSVDDAPFEREGVMKIMDRKRAELEAQLRDLEERRSYFERHFGQFWTPVVAGATEEQEATS
jgi:hypothetical protein